MVAFILISYLKFCFSVNGGWGGLGSYGACSAACGGGIQRAYRKCNNPPAAHGGAVCSGSASAVRACNTHHCPGICICYFFLKWHTHHIFDFSQK